MKHKKVLSVLFAAAIIGLLLSSQSVFAQSSCTATPYGYYNAQGQPCSPNAPAPQPTQPAPTAVPTQIPVYSQPTSVPANQSAVTLVGGEVLGANCSVPYAYSSDGALICSVQCGNVWRSSAGGCPSGSATNTATTVVNVVPVYDVGISYSCYAAGNGKWNVHIYSTIGANALGKVRFQHFRNPDNLGTNKLNGLPEEQKYIYNIDPTGLEFRVIYIFYDGTERLISTTVYCSSQPPVPAPVTLTVAEQSTFVLTHECLPLHAKVIPHLQAAGAVATIEWNPSIMSGWAESFWLSPTHTYVSGKITFTDGSFITASVGMNCPVPTPTPQPAPQTNLPTCTWTPYGYFTDTGLPCTP